MAESLDEPSVIPCEAQELTNVVNCLRLGPPFDRLNLVFHDAYCAAADDMAAELDLRLVELAFRRVGVELVFRQDLEYLPEMVTVLLFRIGIDGDIVKVHDDE